MGAGQGKHYKIKHLSGRVLGPLDLGRVRLLISKNQLTGSEPGREHPGGEWTEIRKIPEIAEALLLHAKGELKKKISDEERANENTYLLPGTEPQGALHTLLIEGEEERDSSLSESEPTRVAIPEKNVAQKNEVPFDPEEGDPTQVHGAGLLAPWLSDAPKVSAAMANEPTVHFEGLRPGGGSGRKKKPTPLAWLRIVLIAGGLGYFGYETFLEERPGSGSALTIREIAAQTFRPELPRTSEGAGDPSASLKLYTEAIRSYVDDTVSGYKRAAKLLLRSIEADSSNVKAYALLASCYLNLIDSSNKDERTFSVISKLVELSKAKQVDLPETVIADTEFYLLTRRFEAAKSRIVDYTKSHSGFGQEMFYYLALTLYSEGSLADAARYLGQYTDKPFGPRIPYLRAAVAEKLADPEEAYRGYRKALESFPLHAKSRLKVVELLHQMGRVSEANRDLQELFKDPTLLSPKDLALAFYLRARFHQVKGEWETAMGDVEKAATLDRLNQLYLLELYSLQAKAGEKDSKLQGRAKMYWFLAEGEKKISKGEDEAGFNLFLQARQADDHSEIPLLRIGDEFLKKNDLRNALLNYKKATEVRKGSLDAWSKYIGALISGYEFEEASHAMEGLRPVESAKSAVDRLAGDLYAKQGYHAQAQEFYRKSMARETIDPSVYISYARSLLASGTGKEAPFFFALALRFDPGNVEATEGTARSIALSDSIDRATAHLQAELSRSSVGRGKLLATLADLWLQKGEWIPAQNTIQQAKEADPGLAEPWKIEAKLLLARDPSDPKTLPRAVAAYRAAVDRNPHDAEARIELFRLLLRGTQFEAANEELNRIYETYPKYPSLHYLKGSLYSKMGNRKAAIEEYKQELKLRANHHDSLIGLAKEYIDENLPEDALRELTKVMKGYPRSAEARHLAGYCNFLLKNYEASVALYQSAVPLDAGNPLLFKRMGAAYRAMGDQQKASEAFQHYLDLAPDAPDRAEIQRFL